MIPLCPEFLHLGFDEAKKFCETRKGYRFEWCEELRLFHILKYVRVSN